MPGNWSAFNDFFCSVTPRPRPGRRLSPRASDAPATGGDLEPDLPYWRGVYEEKVGDCPAGWFPDTYLVFTWNRTDDQIVLRYKLAPRRPDDRTVLKIDEGYVQVDQVGDKRYEVSTVKYLLFDDDRYPSGGQTLARTACQLGWLDYSINQFTSSAADLRAPSKPASGGPPRGPRRPRLRTADRAAAV